MSYDLSDVLDGVNLDEVDTSERSSYAPLPAGDYLVQIVEGEIVRKDNGNAMIKLVFEVMDGPHEGRKLFENLNIRHANSVAQKIALETLTELWRDAMGGTGNPTNVEQMTFRPVRARVAIEKRKDTGDLQNRIKRFFPFGGATQPAAQTKTSPAQSDPQQSQKQRTAPAVTGGRAPPSFLRERKSA